MKMEQCIRAIAGSFILISVALGWFHHRYWFLFTAFVGLNLLQSAFTKWCLMEDILAKLGVAEKPCCAARTNGAEE
jgi:Inner membrane protein YgaP-like, transmembrane domain